MTITNKVSLKSVMAGNTPIADVPDAPTIGVATAGTESATVTYTAAATGGTATTFTATSSPGSITGTGSSPITVSGLTGGTAYTFTVRGSNSTGTSPESAATSPVTPNFAASFESIATVTVGASSQASISFTSIPANFKHLQLRWIAFNGSTWMRSVLKLNNDTTASNYGTHGMQAAGSGTPTAFFSDNTIKIGGANQTEGSGGPGVSIIDILDYSNTNKYKTLRGIFGYDANGSGQVQTASVLWQSTNAINEIVITDESSNNFTQYSRFALYGIRG